MMPTDELTFPRKLSEAAATDPYRIRFQLQERGYSLVRLARELGVSQAVVSNTIRGKTTCYRVAHRVAQLLGSKPEALWPGRYQFKPRPVVARAAAG